MFPCPWQNINVLRMFFLQVQKSDEIWHHGWKEAEVKEASTADEAIVVSDGKRKGVPW